MVCIVFVLSAGLMIEYSERNCSHSCCDCTRLTMGDQNREVRYCIAKNVFPTLSAADECCIVLVLTVASSSAGDAACNRRVSQPNM